MYWKFIGVTLRTNCVKLSIFSLQHRCDALENYGFSIHLESDGSKWIGIWFMGNEICCNACTQNDHG